MGFICQKVLSLLLVAGINFGLAQRDTTTELIADTIVNEGNVIAYGKLLEKPYQITLVNDTMFINHLQISPPLPIPAQRTITPLKETELGKAIIGKMLPFQTRCGELYGEWVCKYGEEKAVGMLKAMLDTQQVIRIKDYTLGKGSLHLVYDYKWGDLYENTSSFIKERYLEIYIELVSWVSKYQNGTTVEKTGEEERVLETKRHNRFLLKEITGVLIQGGLFFVDFSNTIEIVPQDAEGIIRSVKDVIHASLPDSVKISTISKLFYDITYESAAEFLKNSDSWEVDDEK